MLLYETILSNKAIAILGSGRIFVLGYICTYKVSSQHRASDLNSGFGTVQSILHPDFIF